MSYNYNHTLPSPVKNALQTIDSNGDLPLYKQLFKALKAIIVSEEVKSGSFFATESLIKKELNISRDTIRKSLSELEQQGYLLRITGKGTFVSISMPEKSIVLSNFKSMTQEIQDRGMTPGTIIIDADKIKPSVKLMKKLHLKESDTVLFIERLRTGNDIPILYEQAFIPFFSTLENININNLPSSLYELIKSGGKSVHSANHIITATNMNKKVSKLLGVKESTAGLAMERTTFDAQMTPVIYEEGVFRTDLYYYTLTMKNK